MHRYLYRTILFACLLCLALAACSGNKSSAPQAVQDYLQALVDEDADRIVTFSCADWEASARTEVDSLTAVSGELEGVQCQEAGEDAGDTLVTCTGKIVFDYNGELQELDLTGRTYAVREEQGEWRVCGYR
jgi:hypothetical protein